jgi:hypothetical protein
MDVSFLPALFGTCAVALQRTHRAPLSQTAAVGPVMSVPKMLAWTKPIGSEAPISLEDLAATTRATFRICESLRTGQVLSV